MKPVSISLTKKVSLIFILTFTTIAAIDSTIVKFYSTSGEELPPSSNTMIFVLFAVIFATSGFILLNSVKKDTRSLVYKLPSKMKYLYGLIVATQTFMVVIIVTIIFQILSINKYNVALLQASTYVTHISALVFLIFLVIIFVGWLKSRRTYISILYAIAFALVSVTILISMIYLQAQFSVTINPDRKPFPINTYVIRQETKPYVEVLGTTIDVLSFSSFLAMWMATIALLSKYRFKLGRVRYFTLITIPLIYYVFPFEAYFGNLFSPLILTSPVDYTMLYVLIFSATKQVGALLFSLAFWTASSLVSQPRVKKSLLLSSIGIVLLFGSLDVVTLQYRLFPPFGLITEAFMPLGSYLLFVGIFASAISVSRDAALRKEFYKSAESQLNLLKTIGVTQMEKELLREYKPILDRTKILEKYEDQPVEQSELKEIIRDILQELQLREGDNTKDKSK
jgi:hypothetical protein